MKATLRVDIKGDGTSVSFAFDLADDVDRGRFVADFTPSKGGREEKVPRQGFFSARHGWREAPGRLVARILGRFGVGLPEFSRLA